MKYIFLLIVGLNLITSVAKAQDPCERRSYYFAKVGSGDMNDQCNTLCAGLADYLCNAPTIAEIDWERYRQVIEASKSAVRSMNGPGEPDCCKELLSLQPNFSTASDNGDNKVDFGSIATDLSKMGVAPEDLMAAGLIAGGVLLIGTLLNNIPIPMEPKKLKKMKDTFRYGAEDYGISMLGIKGEFNDKGFVVKETLGNEASKTLKKGDIITEVNQIPLQKKDEFNLELIKNNGNELIISFLRDKKTKSTNLKAEKPLYHILPDQLPEFFPKKGTVVFPTGAVFYGEMYYGYPTNGTFVFEDFTYTGKLRLEKHESGEIFNSYSQTLQPIDGLWDYPLLGMKRYYTLWDDKEKGAIIAYKYSNGDSIKILLPKIAFGKCKMVHVSAEGKKYHSDFPALGEKRFKKFFNRLPTQELKREIIAMRMFDYNSAFFDAYAFGNPINSLTNKFMHRKEHPILEFIAPDDPLAPEYEKIIKRSKKLMY